MFDIKSRIVRFVTKVFHNSLQCKNIVILIGDKGCFLSVLHKGKTINSIFIPKEDQLNLSKYQQFLSKYHKFPIFFLLDTASCRLDYKEVPVLEGMIKISPMGQLIAEDYDPQEIVAYDVFDVTGMTSKTWHSTIMATALQPPLTMLLNYLVDNFFKFGGIYFLNLEFKSIIDNLLKRKEYLDHEEDLQIFITTLGASGIKVIIKHRGNILSVKNIEYPAGKSDEYVQGTVEQEINDALIAQKFYVAQKGIAITIILLVEQALKTKMKGMTFGEHKVILLSGSAAGSNKLPLEDARVIELFAGNKDFPGTNSEIKSIMYLSKLNFWLFKPLMLISLCLVIYLGYIKFEIYQSRKNILAVNRQYYHILGDYRKIKEKYPAIKNISALADLYNMESLLKVPVPEPFDLLSSFVANLTDRTHLLKIKWDLKDKDNVTTQDRQVTLQAYLNFSGLDQLNRPGNPPKEITDYIDKLKSQFTNYHVAWSYKGNELVSISKHYIVPVKINITGPIKGR